MHHYEQDVPFEVPQGWVWCKLDDLAFYKKGPFGSSLTKSMFVLKGDNTYKVYEQKNAIQKNEKLGTYYISKEKYQELIAFAIQPFDIIVSCAGTIGETFVLPQEPMEGIINQALMLVRLYNRDIEKFYLLYFDYILKEEAYKESKGTAIKNIPPFDVLKNFYIPLPPFSEQQRIVAEIERWLALIDTIEQGKVELQTAIKQMKSKVLDLAIHGKLVPQDASDEPASELLKRINPKAQSTCDNEHSRKLRAKGWVQCTLNDVFTIIMGQSPDGNSINEKNGVEFHQGKLFFSQKELLKSPFYTTSPVKIAEPNSLVLCVRAPVGDINTLDRRICIGRGLCNLRPNSALDLGFVYYSMLQHKAPLENKATGSTFKSISKNIICKEYFYLPPLAEQKRIVQKIEELFSIIDTVEQALQA